MVVANLDQSKEVTAERLAASPGNGGGAETHLDRLLNAQMTEPTNTEDRDDIAQPCAGGRTYP